MVSSQHIQGEPDGQPEHAPTGKRTARQRALIPRRGERSDGTEAAIGDRGQQLSLSQLKILKLLDLTEAHNIGDVAAFLGVSDAAASKTVDRLARLRYLRRTEPPGPAQQRLVPGRGAQTAELVRSRQGPEAGRDVSGSRPGPIAADFLPDIMYSLKREAIQYQLYPPRFPVPVLAQEFCKMVRARGRSSESWLALAWRCNRIP